jgi:3-dehydroquinate synthase II
VDSQREKAVVAAEDIALAKKLNVKTVSPSQHSDIILIEEGGPSGAQPSVEHQRTAVHVVVKSKLDEDRVRKIAEKGCPYVVVTCPDWKVIPIENLIASVRGRTKLIAKVARPADAKLLLETLELGVDGIAAECENKTDLDSYRSVLEPSFLPLELSTARITAIRQLGTGLRACVDTTEIMQRGEGLLVGSKSLGLFLVEAEVHENPHVAPRPFRVNAGAVSLYILTDRDKTRYLSEIRAGDEVLIVDRSGKARSAHVGRSKIERRPLILVEAEARNGHKCVALLQNAETIPLMTPSDSIRATDLKVGDEVLVHVQEGGRHFGTLVKDETVIEQ